MREKWFAVICAMCMVWAAATLAAAPATSAKKKSSAKTSVKSGGKVTSKKAAKKGTARASSSRKSGKKAAQSTWRDRQRTPSPERYKQIQEALAAKGYLTGEPNGVWGADSVEALKRFQQEQHLEATGKITSLSLIALGLGPKYDRSEANASGQ